MESLVTIAITGTECIANRQTNKQTNKQTDILLYIYRFVEYFLMMRISWGNDIYNYLFFSKFSIENYKRKYLEFLVNRSLSINMSNVS